MNKLQAQSTRNDYLDDRPAAPVNEETALIITSSQFQGGSLIINYEVPFDGIVDFKIIDESGEKKYHNQYNAKKGQNRIRVKPLNASHGSYQIEIYYKGHLIKKSFTYA